MERIGELTAFLTAVCWTFGALFFERSVKQIGVMAVNFLKVVVAFIFMTITVTLLRGMPIPFDATLNNWVFLSLSSLTGFVITNTFLFNAYGTVGPRVAMLFMALSPPITAGIAYVFLGESLGPRSLLGMSLVLTGIFMTVFGRSNSFEFAKISKEDRRGYIFALCASIGQSIAMNLQKIGAADFDPVSGAQIRVFTAVIGFGLISLIYYRGKNIKNAFKNPLGLKYMFAGAFFSPFLGAILVLYAIQRVSAGVVSTLVGLTPILILIPELLFFKKKIKPLEIAGAIIAVVGTMLFFL